MAIYHFSMQTVSRAKGMSSVAKSAYNSCDKIKNEYDGKIHNYSNKPDHTYHEIILPKNAPSEWQDKSKLWNEVEVSEKSKNARLCRSFDIALPKELNQQEQEKLIHDFCKENFSDKGMCVQIDIHSKQENPHAHVMTTCRGIDENGKWQAKSCKEYLCTNGNEKAYFKPNEIPENWEKVLGKNGEPKSRKVDLNNWNSKDTLLEWRKNWSEKCNEYLREKGEKEISHKSHAERGVWEQPQIHLGSYNYKLMQEGKTNERIDKYKNIIEWNKQIEEFKKRFTELWKKFKQEIQQPTTSIEQKAEQFREEKELNQFKSMTKHELLEEQTDLLMVRDRKRNELDNIKGFFFVKKQKEEIQKEIDDISKKLGIIETELKNRRANENKLDRMNEQMKTTKSMEKVTEERELQTERAQEFNKQLFHEEQQEQPVFKGYDIKPKEWKNNDMSKGAKGMRDSMEKSLEKAQKERMAKQKTLQKNAQEQSKPKTR